MKAVTTKPIHPEVKLHYHNFIFSKKSKKLIWRVAFICQKGAEIVPADHFVKKNETH